MRPKGTPTVTSASGHTITRAQDRLYRLIKFWGILEEILGGFDDSEFCRTRMMTLRFYAMETGLAVFSCD